MPEFVDATLTRRDNHFPLLRQFDEFIWIVFTPHKTRVRQQNYKRLVKMHSGHDYTDFIWMNVLTLWLDTLTKFIWFVFYAMKRARSPPNSVIKKSWKGMVGLSYSRKVCLIVRLLPLFWPLDQVQGSHNLTYLFDLFSRHQNHKKNLWQHIVYNKLWTHLLTYEISHLPTLLLLFWPLQL